MSTRGGIVKLTNKGFKGVYHHWDSYPSGLGKSLFKLYNGHFKKNIKELIKTLIDDHPAGWSTICDANFSEKPGFLEYTTREKLRKNSKKLKRPQCYCHGDRKEKAQVINEKNASDSGCEWIYAFEDGKPVLHILASYCDPNGKFAGQKMIGAFGYGDPKAIWKIVKTVDLSGEEPDWEKVYEVAK